MLHTRFDVLKSVLHRFLRRTSVDLIAEAREHEERNRESITVRELKCISGRFGTASVKRLRVIILVVAARFVLLVQGWIPRGK